MFTAGFPLAAIRIPNPSPRRCSTIALLSSRKRETSSRRNRGKSGVEILRLPLWGSLRMTVGRATPSRAVEAKIGIDDSRRRKSGRSRTN
jgi:hypothetical protein